MTSPTNPGSGLSARLEERLAEHEDAIEGHARARGLPEPEPRSIDQYLNMQRSEVRAMSGQELAEVAWEVSAYGYFLQDQANRVQVRLDKLDHEIRKIAYPAAERQDAFKFEDKLALATLGDPVARELADKRAVALGYMTRWAKLGYLLSDFAKRLDAIIQEKRSRG